MHFDSLSLKQHGLLVSLLAALWASGCGGSVSGGGAGGMGASAGVSGSGAGPSGGSGGGGAPNGGSAGSCAQTGCPAIACAVGYKYIYEPGACCPTCVPDDSGGSGGVGGCALVDCSAPVCDPGYVAQQAPDACCPVCVLNAACMKGQQGYDNLRSTLLAQPGAMACKVDNDCALLPSDAYCSEPCPSVPVNAAAAQSINGELSLFANDNCSVCPPVYTLCPVSLPAVCAQGQCTLQPIDK
jgi:hypothetical protein